MRYHHLKDNPNPQIIVILTKILQNPERLLFLYIGMKFLLKLYASNFFKKKFHYIFSAYRIFGFLLFFFFAWTVHLAIDSHEMKCINIRSIKEVQCVSYITCSMCKVNALNDLVQ